MKDIAELLREHRFTAGLRADWVEFIAGCARNAKFDAGEMIFRAGDDAAYFYMVRFGSVALEMGLPGHELLTVLTIGPGDVLGTSWLVPPYRWQFDARAVELTRAVAFDAGCLREKCDGEPALGFELMKRFVPMLVERLHTARIQCADIYGKPTT
jgi:CRP-like cAMP-binding protein